MSDFLNLLGAIGQGEAPRIGDKEEVGGLTVSTVNSYDMGYETAIIDANGTHPVERYEAETEAREGHVAWVNRADSLTEITKLGYGDLVDDETVVLVRDSA